jgi:hypothetical protein
MTIGASPSDANSTLLAMAAYANRPGRAPDDEASGAAPVANA